MINHLFKHHNPWLCKLKPSFKTQVIISLWVALQEEHHARRHDTSCILSSVPPNNRSRRGQARHIWRGLWGINTVALKARAAICSASHHPSNSDANTCLDGCSCGTHRGQTLRRIRTDTTRSDKCWPQASFAISGAVHQPLWASHGMAGVRRFRPTMSNTNRGGRLF